MKLSDVQNKKEYGIVVSARLPAEYYNFIKRNKINLPKLIMFAIDEVRNN